MIVLGSTYRPIMRALAEELGPDHEFRDFDETRSLEAQLDDVEVLVIGSFRISREVLNAAPRLRLLHQHGRGVDSVDLSWATERGVYVANVPGGNSVAVAEHALALILYMAKGLHQMAKSIARGIIGAPAGIELAGRTLGVVGLGASGTELARRGKALGMRVLATKARPGSAPNVAVDFLGGPGDLSRVLRESDFISLHLPLSEATRGLIGQAELAQMKPMAFLFNVARAGLVDYGALSDALRDSLIAGAGFDVFWSEPADPEDPILKLDNFVLTAHVAGFSDVSNRQVSTAIADNVRRLARGEPLLNVVNPEVARLPSPPKSGC